MSRILVIGDLMLDIYYQGSVNRISPEAPVPVLKKNKGEKYFPGGACNVAMNIVATGNEASLLGAVGNDLNGERLIGILSDAGIDSALVYKVEVDTIAKIRFLSNSNQQLLRMDIEDIESIEKEIDYDSIVNKLNDVIATFDVIVFSDYMKGLLSLEFTQSVINLANKNSIRVLIDVKDPDYEKYKNAWLLKPNLKELNMLTKMPVGSNEQIVEASRYLLVECNCEYVLTTCGSRGMVLVGRNTVHHLGTEGKTVYDVTGAGDTVVAYLASCLSQGESIEHAMEVANYAAGIQVGKVGTASVNIQEVREVMEGAGSSYLKKLLKWEKLDEFCKKEKNKKVVFTNGCFDILHVGHKRYLEEARKLGDLLIVAVNSDDSVKRLKGNNRPINTEHDRMEMVAALDCVDYVILFEEDTPYKLINRIRPGVLVKGGDYTFDEVIGKDIVEEIGGKVVIIPLVEGKSTTSIINQIRN